MNEGTDMLISAIVLALAAVLVIAGLTGIGVYDSRDTGYSLSTPQGARSPYENQLAPQHRRHLSIRRR
jgi:hypothetical protein